MTDVMNSAETTTGRKLFTAKLWTVSELRTNEMVMTVPRIDGLNIVRIS
jgi:hypothetical protein